MSMDSTHIRPSSLCIDNRSSPNDVSLDSPPQFSWLIDSPEWGSGQSAYRILLDPSRERLAAGEAMWDSGRVESARSTAIGYEGPLLASDTTYHWTVIVWNTNGEPSAAADPSTFTTELGNEWSGKWVARQPGTGDSNGYRSQWKNPDGNPTEWVQVNLDTEHEITEIELYPAEPFTETKTPDGWTITANDTEEEYHDATVAQGPVSFGFPERYRIEVADNPEFDDAYTIVDATDTDQADPRRDPVVHNSTTVTAQYIRVIATSLDKYTPEEKLIREEFDTWSVFALAGIAVRDDDGNDLAKNQPVTASSNVETETWGSDRLTDGVYESTMTGCSPLFRTEFEVSKSVASARARFVGLGYGELYINGKRISDDVLNPSWTQYDKRVLYSTYDVTGAVHKGQNAVGIWLGRGWFARSARHWLAFGSPRARLQLTVEYEDGTTSQLLTGSDWKAAPSPIIENDIYRGETYDARHEQEGWTRTRFDDSDWETAVAAAAPNGDLRPQQTDSIEVTETLKPVEIIEHEDGPILDFGQNHTGYLSLDIQGGDPGDEIVLRHAEALDEDNSLQRVDLRSADATDTYIVGDHDTTTYEPHFTYHGYRYAQIIGYPDKLTVDDVRSRVVHTSFPSSGEFACSNEDLSHVQENARWGLRSNAHSVPTDCPQRDERMGFTGDGHIAARALHYNFDASRFHLKWLRDHIDTQSQHGYVPSKCPYGALPSIADPSWTVSLLAIPWHCYRFYGDTGVLQRNYESLRQYVEFWEDEAVDDLLPDEHAGYGDWVALENVDGRIGKPSDFFTNVYYYRSVDLLARIADALELKADADHYTDRAEEIADAFNQRYFDAGENAYEAGTQATYALPVFFGIAPDNRVDDIIENLVQKVVEADNGALQTGFLGTRPLLAVLAEQGHADLAYQIASRPEYPSWVYMLSQGATTVWERWDSDSEEHIGGRMNSLNHSPFTSISEWFYEHLAGINVRFDTDDYCLEIAPSFVDDLSWVEGTVKTPLGPVESRWEASDSGHEVAVRIPWNANAHVTVPLEDNNRAVSINDELVWSGGVAVTMSDAIDSLDRVTHAEQKGSQITFDVGPGSHIIRIK